MWLADKWIQSFLTANSDVPVPNSTMRCHASTIINQNLGGFSVSCGMHLLDETRCCKVLKYFVCAFILHPLLFCSRVGRTWALQMKILLHFLFFKVFKYFQWALQILLLSLFSKTSKDLFYYSREIHYAFRIFLPW